MIRLIIVEDEPLARDRLAALLAEQPDCELLGTAANGAEGLALCEELQPDLILLDVRMPGVDGMSMAEQANTLDNRPLIVFTTAYEQHALEAFGVNALDYLLKPISRDKLAACLARVGERLNQTTSPPPPPDGITLKQGSGLISIPLTDICCLKADHKYTALITPEREYLSEIPLAKFAEAYPDQLIRVHRNALANRTRLTALRRSATGGWLLQIDGVEQPLEVSRRQLAGLKKALGAVSRL
ncbi:MAG: LytTR family DNA-binding domain-containing protein [Gammaproteobacteria bacterium]|nr:LytTR family DNA-binding domain-containing protein [Gammaproteobacteria bacterium]